MSRAIVEQLVALLDLAFEPAPDAGPTDGWHSLIANLTSVRDEDLEWAPPNGKRTIAALALHIGFAFRVYADYGSAMPPFRLRTRPTKAHPASNL